MRIRALRCAQCSAPIDVPFGDQSEKCLYCGSANLVSAKTPQRSTARSDTLNQTDGELQNLDADWERYRARHLSKRNDGTYDVPDPNDWQYQKVGLAVLVVAGSIAILGIAILNQTLAFAAQGFFLLAIVSGIFLYYLRARHNLGVVYARSLENYRTERKRILATLQSS